MKRLISFVVMASLSVGAMALTGCESMKPDSASHDMLFGVGNGEFGEGTQTMGEYPNTTHASPTTQPIAHSD